VFFIDRHMLGMAGTTFAALASMAGEGQAAAQCLVGMMQAINIPSAFLLHGVGNLQVVGTIKEAGMEEPIPTYYFKHGTAGLSDVYIIGVKEVPFGPLSLEPLTL